MAESNSPRLSLNLIDWKKGLTGLGIALAGATMTYLSDFILTIDFGVYTPIVMAFWSFVANLVRKFIASH